MISVKQILLEKYKEIDARQSEVFGKMGIPYKSFSSYLEEETQTTETDTSTAGITDVNALLELLGGSDNVSSVLTQLNSATQITASKNANTDGAAKYNDIIEAAAAKYGLKPSLIKGIIQAESNFNPDSVSSAGAVGLMQLMPETANEVGVTDRNDPEQNIMGACQYIKKLIDRFNGDIKLALAGYNCGPNKVAGLGITSSADLAKYNQLSTGVRSYVERVLSYMLGFESASTKTA